MSNVEIPVLCKNPQCRNIFFAPFMMILSPGSSIIFAGNEYGPCPKCHGMGVMPSGEYRRVSEEVIFHPHSEEDRMFLERAFEIARDAVNKMIALDKAKQTAITQVPKLVPLWDLLPESKEQAYEFWQALLTAVGVLLLVWQSSQTPQLVLSPEVAETLARLKSTLDESHRARPGQSPE